MKAFIKLLSCSIAFLFIITSVSCDVSFFDDDPSPFNKQSSLKTMKVLNVLTMEPVEGAKVKLYKCVEPDFFGCAKSKSDLQISDQNGDVTFDASFKISDIEHDDFYYSQFIEPATGPAYDELYVAPYTNLEFIFTGNSLDTLTEYVTVYTSYRSLGPNGSIPYAIFQESTGFITQYYKFNLQSDSIIQAKGIADHELQISVYYYIIEDGYPQIHSSESMNPILTPKDETTQIDIVF